MTPLSGRVALVTNVGRGIGLSLATRLAVEGAALVVSDVDERAAHDAVEAAAALGATVVPIVGSLTDADFPARFADAGLATFGRIDILVNNAGGVRKGRLEDTGDAHWHATLDLHLGAPFRIIREVVRCWREAPPAGASPRRRIVNVVRGSGSDGADSMAAYASAGAGLIGLTKNLAHELGPEGITVNAVSLGVIETRQIGVTNDETVIAVAREALARRIPLRRAGTAKEAAGAIVLLCGPDADYLTGQVIEVDGGLSA